MFLDTRSRDFYLEWAAVAKDVVAALRIEAGRNPYDRGLTDLVGELSTRSEEFRTWWASHNVRLHRTSTKQMHHPVVGDLELTGEALVLPGDAGLTIITYTVEPSSASEQALNFLASWSAHASTANPSTSPRPDDRADEVTIQRRRLGSHKSMGVPQLFCPYRRVRLRRRQSDDERHRPRTALGAVRGTGAGLPDDGVPRLACA